MRKEKVYINSILKDTFIINNKLHTGFYDGNYRRLIKKSLREINRKTLSNKKIDSYFEIIDFSDSSHLRISVSVPNGWIAERFLEACLKEIKRNPSVDIISESFFSSSLEIEEQFFTPEWRGHTKSF